MARTEIELNKEVLDYKESIFFGLSLRQFICSLLAVIVAVTVYFSLRNILAKEILSWLCLILACPFAVAGFFKFNTLTLEQFLWQMIKTCLIYRGRRVYKSVNSDRLENDKILKERSKDCRWQKKKLRKMVKRNEKLKKKAQKQSQKTKKSKSKSAKKVKK